ncbi:Spore germination lipase LipC [compost metagenome]
MAISLGWAIKDYLLGASGVSSMPSAAEQPVVDSSAYRIVALGDSLTRGTGDSEGKGYAGYLNDNLRKQGWDVSLVNLGIKGLTTTGLLEQLKEKEVLRQIGQADAVVMTIGGNDLFLGGETLTNLEEESISKLETGYLANLRAIFTAIHEAGPEARVYMFGLYDPFSDQELADMTSSFVRGWNNQTMETVAEYEQAVFVPTYDLFQLNVAELLFTDHFHPNDKGYRLMADRLTALIAGAGGRS